MALIAPGENWTARPSAFYWLMRQERRPGVVVRDGEISVQPMRDSDDDYALIARWRSDPRVLEWYGGRDQPLDLAAARARYGARVRGEEPVRACFIALAGRAVRYLQYYPVDDAAEYGLEDATDTWAVDMYIGEPELWGRGLGSRALAVVTKALFAKGARRVAIDPQTRNERAVRADEKAGFRKLHRLPARELHEGVRQDSWILLRDRS